MFFLKDHAMKGMGAAKYCSFVVTHATVRELWDNIGDSIWQQIGNQIENRVLSITRGEINE